MDPSPLDIVVAVVALGGWFAGYALALLATRPHEPHTDPATPDLGDEPPAVVSLLANHWDVNEDAAESTLLDLAARKVIEFRQPAADPMQTTLHLHPAPTGELTAYEQRVLERVRGLAVGGVVPVTALTFRDARQARAWNRRLRAEVVADARGRGLSRRRFGPTALAALGGAAAVVGVVLALVTLHAGLRGHESDSLTTAAGTGFVAFALLSAFAGRDIGERDTPAGRRVAARWLGVRDWLRGHEQFADLPPASVAVWDRYLGYGAALGVTRLTSAVLNLDMGDRKRVWSSYGGVWHRVRVRYPRLWPRYGAPAYRQVLHALLALGVGAVLVRWHRLPVDLLELTATPRLTLIMNMVLGLGLALLLYGCYVLVHTALDLTAPRTLTGQVLWMQEWRRTRGRHDSPPRPWLYYLAVDDGTGDRTTAWGLPSHLVNRCEEYDTVTLRVRPWSRRVQDLSVVEEGPGRRLAESATGEVDPETPAAGHGTGRVVGGSGSGPVPEPPTG